MIRDESTRRIDTIGKTIRWFQDHIKEWYANFGRDFSWRDEGRSVYEIVIAEILLWRTNATNVAKIYDSFIKRYPGWEELSRETEEELREFLKPLGYGERVNILAALAQIMRESRYAPSTRDELQQLPGVGQYIASALLLICHNQPEPLLDVNMARVLERFFGPRKLADIRVDPYLQQLSRAVLPSTQIKEFNWAVLDLGALICISRTPRCHLCPLQDECMYFNRQTRPPEDVGVVAVEGVVHHQE